MSAFTKVRMTFEVTFSQPWGEECTVGQIRKQSLDQAAEVASNLVAHINSRGMNGSIRFESLDPKITVVMPEEKR